MITTDIEDMWEPNYQPVYSEEMGWVGWGGKYRSAPVTHGLGWSVRPRSQKPFGWRRAEFDWCYGIANGFPRRDVFWYVSTRSLSERILRIVLSWEQKRRG